MNCLRLSGSPSVATRSAEMISIRGDIAVITLDNPPVNGLGYETRLGIVAGLEKALADAVNADGKVDGEKLDQVAWPFPGDRSAQEQIEASAKKLPTLSPAAAWPFPDSPNAPKAEPAAAAKTSKARKPKAAKSAEVSA